MAQQVPVARVPLMFHRATVDIPVILDNDSWTQITTCDCRFRCLWAQIMHAIEEFRLVFIESGGECFGFVGFRIYLLKCSFLLS